jgi:glycosyltransferase involved in cell wall biosynthesis
VRPRIVDDAGVSARADQPEVAIVVPCHGYAHFLRDAVASAAAQTWPRLRIVIVDDGSPDDTAAVAQQLRREFPARRIDLVQQANQGLAAARNAGVRHTDAPLILPLDADDRLAPTAVERLVAALVAAGADVATPDAETFGLEQRRLRTRPVTRRRLVANNCLVYASLYRRSLFDRIGGYRSAAPGYEDWDFWLSALELGARFVHVPEVLFHYRKHGRSMLADSDARALHRFAAIAAGHPSLYPRWRVRVAEQLLAAGPAAPLRLRLGMLAALLLDRRLRLFVRQTINLRATNMLST